MKKILFVCVHNSARSQMAEAFLNKLGEGKYIAESAGLEPGHINPLVVEVMAEIGYDISKNSTNSVFDFYKDGKSYSYVIKVCDELNGQKCPVFPQTLNYLNWNLEDPSSIQGSHEEKLVRTRQIRDEIKNLVINLIDSLNK